MSATTANQTTLFDAPGPRARRRIRVFTVLSSAAIVAVLAYALYIFGVNGQLKPEKWEALGQWPIIRYLLGGLGDTMLAAAAAAAIALPLGAVLALARLSDNRPIRWIGTAIIEFFRSIPLLLLIYIFFIALPRYGVNPELYWKLVIPIGLCSGATIAEVFRAGVLALPKGQTEAALAIGMTKGKIYRNVIFPQAIRLVMPSLLAQVVILIKDTTLGYVVSYSELQFSAKVLVANTGYLIQTYLTVTVVFILVNLAIARTADLWSKRQRRRYLNAGKAVAPTVTM